MENFTSDQDELYYSAKNFNKLKYSNTAYVENTTKDKQENQKEIENLKKEYDKLKNDVIILKKKTLYTGGRLQSAVHAEMDNSELNILRQKLDYAKAQKNKSKVEWKKLDEKLKELKNEAKLISDDNNPYMRRIKLLENKLDKAMIKFNEAMSIRRTYEQILNRLREERAGYDNQIMAVQKSLKSKEHDCDEFKLLLQDAKQARSYSELLLKNTKLSKEAFEQHFEQLIKAHEIETKNEIKNERMLEENKRKLEKLEVHRNTDEEDMNVKHSHNHELEKRVREYEEADKLIRETTGADDINEICQKFSNLRETKDKLKKERKELEKMCDTLGRKKDDLGVELKTLKYQGQDEITRKEIEDNEKTAERTLKSCEEARYKLKKSEKLMVDVRAGISMIIGILKGRTFEDMFEDKNTNEKDSHHKQAYLDLINIPNEKDLRITLNRIMEVCDFLHQKYKSKEQHFNEDEMRLTRKEENDIEHLYLNQHVDSNQNSEYGPDDDLDAEMNNKEMIFKNDLNSLGVRPYSSEVKKSTTTRFMLKAKDKKF